MILLFLFGLIVAAVLVALVGRLVVALVRIALAAAAAFVLTAVAGAAIGINPASQPLETGALFLVSSALVLAVAIRVRRHAKLRQARLPHASTSVRAAPERPVFSRYAGHDDISDLRRLEEAGQAPWWGRAGTRARARTKRLALAWQIMAERAEGRRNRIAVAKAACDQLLSMEAAGLLPLSAIDTAANIRGNVPDSVAAWLRHAVTAGATERGQAFEALVRSFERLGARAEREIADLAGVCAGTFAFERHTWIDEEKRIRHSSERPYSALAPMRQQWPFVGLFGRSACGRPNAESGPSGSNVRQHLSPRSGPSVFFYCHPGLDPG